MAKKTYLIVNRRSGKALQATGLDNGLVVEQSEITYQDPQLWTLEGKGAQTRLLNKASGKALDVMQGGSASGTWAQIWEDVQGESQFWNVSMASRGYRKIQHVQSGKVLDIQDLSDESGAPAQLWDDVGGAGQEWKLSEYPARKTVEKKGLKNPRARKTVDASPNKSLKKSKAASTKGTAKKAVKKASKPTNSKISHKAAELESAKTASKPSAAEAKVGPTGEPAAKTGASN